MLTELQAWEVLFCGFANPQTHNRQDYPKHDGWAIIYDWPKECLCDGIAELRGQNQISDAVYWKMRGLIWYYGRFQRTTPYVDMFFWPRNQEGAYERAKFCARMIEQRHQDLFRSFGLQGFAFRDLTHMWYI